jgi:hypothetical protein
MQIKLREYGPPMWFLGEPKAIKLSLTYLKPGPENIDFEKLTLQDQAHILRGIRDEIVEVDTPYEVLHKQYTNNIPPMAVPPQPAVQAAQPVAQETPKESIVEIRREKEEKFQRRCEHISKQSARVLKAALKGTEDIRLARQVLHLETLGRNRTSVRDYLKGLIQKLQGEVTLKMKESESEKPLKNVIPVDPLGYEVIEEDQETVTIAVE